MNLPFQFGTKDLRFNLNLAMAHLKLRDFSKAIAWNLQN